MFDVLPITSEKQVDCGPTCLQMLLAYYGIEADLDELIKDCNVRVNGCSATELLTAARKHGLTDIIAYKMDADELIRQDRPAIVWWRYAHFVVFCGRNDRGDVVICNPDKGRYGIDAGSFASMYSGISLWNGEPQDLPQPEPDTETAELAEAARILLGVSE